MPTRIPARCIIRGDFLGVASLAVVGATGDWCWLRAALVAGYALAWLSHLVFEHNRPATFRHPYWSFVSDLRMLALFLSQRLDRGLRRKE
jgi:hypothetical protein